MRKELSEMTLEELWELFPIVLEEYNPEYKEWYLTEKNKIEKIVGMNDIKRINYIGSSSVEGLISKPIVDILLEVDCNSDVEQIKSKLINAGWTLMSFKSQPDLNMSFNKGYTLKGFDEKVFHLHVRFCRDWGELYFRDYLLIHADIAKEYGRLKQGLKEQYEHNRDGYTEAKTGFIAKYTKMAREEFGGRYMPDCGNEP